VSDQFEATLFWMDKSSLMPGRSYYLKIASQTISATVSEPKYSINVNTLEKTATKTLSLNSIGVANITTDRSIPFSAYQEDRNLGSFILIDKVSNSTACAGMINFGLRRAQNVHWQATDISRTDRSNQKDQKPKVIWMTGISGAGKSTIANALERKLIALNKHTFLLDGDNIRHGLNKDLGFTDADRIENIRRVGEVAKLMSDAGLIVITAFISPFEAERMMVRKIMNKNEFVEVLIHAPLAVAEKRDVKGLYAKARAGKLKNFTGIDSPYEIPKNPEIIIDTTKVTAEEAADLIKNYVTSDIKSSEKSFNDD
jgi:bifunctional enzyme CysN/CysC